MIRRHGLFVLLTLSGFVLGGCGTLRSGTGWGARATATPGTARIGSALVSAARDPCTWAPAVGAAIFGVTGWDDRVSDWASEHTPVFGSQRAAERAGDGLLAGEGVAALLTALATTGGGSASEVAAAKAKGLAVEGSAVGATLGTTLALKRLTGRTRPDGSDDQSFPSGHSSLAFAFASLSRENLRSVPVMPALRTGLDLAFTAAAAATAWSRVEAEEHYPSDVLAGAALGNFMAGFIAKAFLGLEPGDALALRVDPGRGGFLVNISLRY